MSTSILGEPLLSLQDLAGYLAVDVRTVRTLISDGRLQALRVGNQLRVEPGELQRFLAASVEPPKATS